MTNEQLDTELSRLRALNAELLAMLRWGIESMTINERDRWRFEARNVVAKAEAGS